MKTYVLWCSPWILPLLYLRKARQCRSLGIFQYPRPSGSDVCTYIQCTIPYVLRMYCTYLISSSREITLARREGLISSHLVSTSRSGPTSNLRGLLTLTSWSWVLVSLVRQFFLYNSVSIIWDTRLLWSHSVFVSYLWEIFHNSTWWLSDTPR